MRAHRKPPHAVPDCDRSRRAAHHRAARYRAAAPHAPRLCAAPRRAAPPSDTTAPRSPRRRRRSRCRTGRSSLAREPTRHRGALAKGRWSDHPAGACQKAWPQRTLDRADLRREKRQCAGSAGAGRREVSAVSALLARGRQASRAAERSRMWCLGRASQSDGCLAPPPAVRHGRVLCGRPWKRLERRPCLVAVQPVAVQPGWSKDTSSKSNERLEIADSSSEQTIIPFAV